MKVTIQSIMDAAFEDGKVFTASQAQRILDRHRQLVKEGHSVNQEKDRQIDECWKWFYGYN